VGIITIVRSQPKGAKPTKPVKHLISGLKNVTEYIESIVAKIGKINPKRNVSNVLFRKEIVDLFFNLLTQKMMLIIGAAIINIKGNHTTNKFSNILRAI
jgi:hypothetical protein